MTTEQQQHNYKGTAKQRVNIGQLNQRVKI